MKNAVNSMMTQTSVDGTLAERSAPEVRQRTSVEAGRKHQMVHSLRHFLDRICARLAFACIYARGKIFGISHVIQYMRNPNPLVSVRLLRAFGATVGEDTTIKRSLILDNVYGDLNSAGDFSHLKIGNDCYLGDDLFFDLANDVIIEDHAVLAGQISLITHAECRRSDFIRERFPRKCAPVVIGSGAWVGFGVTVFPSVRIGNNCAIGARALVLEDTEPEYVYMGIPAKKIRHIE